MADNCATLKRGRFTGRTEIRRPVTIGAFIGLAILGVTCIIGAIGFHTPFKDVFRAHPAANLKDESPKDEHGLSYRHQRVVRRHMSSAEIDRFERSVMLITSVKLNATDAAIYCHKSSKSRAKLFFPRNHDEESIVTSLLDTKSQEYGSPLINQCINGLFIGLRKSLNYAWMNREGRIRKYSAPFIYSNYSVDYGDASSRCVSLIKDDSKNLETKLLFNYINCERSDSWQCILCESSCIVSKTGACYSVYADRPEVIDYSTALEFCSDMANSPGELASILHPSMLNEVYDQISIQMDQCKMVTIGNRVTAAYESFDGMRMHFNTKHVVFRPERNIRDNCIIASKSVEFWWEPADCTEARCFICKTRTRL